MYVLMVGTMRVAHEKLIELEHQIVLFIKKDEVLKEDATFPYLEVHQFSADADLKRYIQTAIVLHKNKPFDAICCLHDKTQNIAIAIAKELGLYFPITLESLLLTRSKNKTRKSLAEKGLDETAYQLVNSDQETESFIQHIKKTVIIKPVDGAGSRGILKIDSTKNINSDLKKWKKVGGTYPAIIEEFLIGEEFSVEGISENGQHRIIAITKKFKDNKSFIETGHGLPADLDSKIEKQIVEYVKEVLTALEFENGPSHSELILTDNGPRLIETHTRPGGDYIFDLIRIATGIDLIELAVKQCLGEKILHHLPQDLPKDKYAAVKYIYPQFDNHTRLKKILCIEDAKKSKGIVEIHILKSIGDKMAQVVHSFDRTAAAIACGNTLQDALDNATNSLSNLAFELEWKKTSSRS